MQEEHQGIPEPFGLIIPGQAVRTDFQPTDASASKFTMTLHFPSPSSSSTTTTTTTNTTGNDGGIKSPTEIADLVFFLLPNITLPPNTGATLYWSATSHNNPTASSSSTTTTTTTTTHHHHYPNGMNNTPFSNYHTNNNTSEFELLGALTPDKTSAVFRTGWGSHERLLYLISNSNNITSTNITTTNNNNNNNNTFMNNNNSSSTFLNNGIGSTQQQQQQQPTGISITLGISIEPLDAISNLSLNNSGVSNRTNVAKKIAMDLFNYLQSFDDTNSTSSTSSSTSTRTGNNNVKSGWMMVPINVFERWFTRFENKVSRDPNFFMKHEI